MGTKHSLNGSPRQFRLAATELGPHNWSPDGFLITLKSIKTLLGDMPVEVFNSFEKFRNRFSNSSFVSIDSHRLQALQIHFGKGGVIQIDSTIESDWPKLVYPSVQKIELQVEKYLMQKQKFSSQKREWELNHFKVKSQDVIAHLRKVVDPLFWQHITRKVLDEQYRKDAKTIDLKSRLISHQKYRPMIHAFVTNNEYRKQLTQTVKESIVYKNHKGLARHAEELKELQASVSEDQAGKAGKKLDENEKQLFVLRELLKWGEEKK